MHMTAGKILCGSCDVLFGEFFVSGKRNGAEYMREAFKAWDEDSSGWIDTGELRRVLKAIMPNFSDRDLNDLLRVIDTNGNGVVEYEEFCQWLVKENLLDFSSSTFSAYVSQLMREAGQAKDKASMCVDEIQVRDDGVYFRLQCGTVRLETTTFRADSLQLTALEPEEFISKVECVEDGLEISFNTGRVTTLPGKGPLFGPFEAPLGFYIDGLRVKPMDAADESGAQDFVTGVDLAPLPHAAEYDAPSALLYTAEQEYLRSLREILAKAAVDVNAFGAGGVTALMLAASRGATGSMRMLISSKANPNLADSDGWTALTYASRCGSPEAVQALLEKGAKEGEGDGGRALKEALRTSHNSAARALLRAGFGPAPPGTFALEGRPKPEDCKLDAPAISPCGGAFTAAKTVSIMMADQDAAKLANGVKVLYTVDGRDPFLAGYRYIGPFTVSQPRVQLRAVAVLGGKRSQVAEATFVVCHCALPDEIVFGVLRAQIFPAATDLVLKYTGETVQLPPERLQANISEAADHTPRWVQVDLHDLKPRHQIRFDLAYATVKSADKRKKWTESIMNDIQKAVNEAPLDSKVFAGSIILEFQMTREQATELAKQIQDPTSWLLTKGKNRKAFQRATMQSVEALGARLSATRFRDEVEERIKSKTFKPRVVAVGKGDRGAIACLVNDKKEAKWMKKQLDSVVRKLLEDVEFTEVVEHSEYLDIDFSVDIMDAGKGREIVETLQDPESTTKIADLMAIYEGIDTNVSVVSPAASRKLADLEVVMKWSAKSAAVMDGLDCSCFVFAEEHFLHCANFSGAAAGQDAAGASGTSKDGFHQEELIKKVKRALRHCAPTSEHAQEARMIVDVSAMPMEVTDLFFVMSSFEADDLSSFTSPSFSLIDVAREQELTTYSFAPQSTRSAIVCNLSRHNNAWVVHGVGKPCMGDSRKTEELLNVLADFQGRHLNWERRRELVKLRVLQNCGRMAKSSGSDFALLMQMIMELPVEVFQSLLKFV